MEGLQQRGLRLCQGTTALGIRVQVALYEVVTTVLMQTFAIMGGLYTAANCISKRMRQKDDGRLHTLKAQVIVL